jgi:uncharacterized membrane protein HdeD (DUF308 family)
MPGNTPFAREPGAPLRQTGARLTWAGVGGLVLGASGFAMMLALPVFELGWYGALLTLLGIIQLAELSRRLSGPGLALRALIALVYVGCGLTLVLAPGEVAPLRLLIATLFVAAGLFRIAWAIAWRGAPRSWGVMAGLGTGLLGLVLLIGWPVAGLWVLGAAVAADLILYGVNALALGRALRG